MILAETIVRDRGPPAHLLLADPDVSAANREGLATNLDEGMAIVPVIAAEVVAESLFVTSTIIDRELELLSKPNATF